MADPNADPNVEEKKQAANEALQTLPPDAIEAKKDIANAALQTLPPDATQAKKDIANAAIQALPPDATQARIDVARTAAQALTSAEQGELASRLQGPSSKISDRIWQWIVAAFAIVFVGGTGGLIVGVFINPTQLQILVTVFTTVAGILAGSYLEERVLQKLLLGTIDRISI